VIRRFKWPRSPFTIRADTSVPGETYMGTRGNWYGYTALFPRGGDDRRVDDFSASVARCCRVTVVLQPRRGAAFELFE